MIYQSEDDRKNFASSKPLLQIICAYLEFELKTSHAQLELISFDENYAYVTFTRDDLDLLGLCEQVNAVYRRSDKLLSCTVYSEEKYIIEVYGTEAKDLAYLL